MYFDFKGFGWIVLIFSIISALAGIGIYKVLEYIFNHIEIYWI